MANSRLVNSVHFFAFFDKIGPHFKRAPLKNSPQVGTLSPVSEVAVIQSTKMRKRHHPFTNCAWRRKRSAMPLVEHASVRITSGCPLSSFSARDHDDIFEEIARSTAPFVSLALLFSSRWLALPALYALLLVSPQLGGSRPGSNPQLQEPSRESRFLLLGGI